MRAMILVMMLAVGCAESVSPGATETFFTVGPEPVTRYEAYDYCAQIGGTMAREEDADLAIQAIRDADFDDEQPDGWLIDHDASGTHVAYRQVTWEGDVIDVDYARPALPVCEITLR